MSRITYDCSRFFWIRRIWKILVRLLDDRDKFKDTFRKSTCFWKPWHDSGWFPSVPGVFLKYLVLSMVSNNAFNVANGCWLRLIVGMSYLCVCSFDVKLKTGWFQSYFGDVLVAWFDLLWQVRVSLCLVVSMLVFYSFGQRDHWSSKPFCPCVLTCLCFLRVYSRECAQTSVQDYSLSPLSTLLLLSNIALAMFGSAVYGWI